jgi:hypothetical protein
VITALDRIYFRRDTAWWPHYELAILALELHRLAPFDVLPPEDR